MTSLEKKSEDFALKNKGEVIEATKRAIAKFDALVGVPIGNDGKPLVRPKVRRLHRDHEGQLESSLFESFRADASLHSIHADHEALVRCRGTEFLALGSPAHRE